MCSGMTHSILLGESCHTVESPNPILTPTVIRSKQKDGTPTFFRAWLNDIPNQFMHWIRLTNTLCCVKNFAANHDVHHYTSNIVSCEKDMSKVGWELFESGRDAGGFIYDVWY